MFDAAVTSQVGVITSQARHHLINLLLLEWRDGRLDVSDCHQYLITELRIELKTPSWLTTTIRLLSLPRP